MMVWVMELASYMPNIFFHECTEDYDPKYLILPLGYLDIIQSIVIWKSHMAGRSVGQSDGCGRQGQ